MSAIDNFNKLNRELRQAIEWRSLIGSRYEGGGGGYGKIVGVHGNIEIYHQAYNGARNYHEVPSEAIKECIDEAIERKAISIIDDAIALLRKRVIEAAELAETERLTIADAITKNKEILNDHSTASN